jgi:hypothetical protein
MFSPTTTITWARLFQVALFVQINVRTLLEAYLCHRTYSIYPGMSPGEIKGKLNIHPPLLNTEIGWSAAGTAASIICGDFATQKTGFPTQCSVGGVIERYMQSNRYPFCGTGFGSPTGPYELGTVTHHADPQNIQNSVRLVFEQVRPHIFWLCEEIWSNTFNYPVLTSEGVITNEQHKTLMDYIFSSVRNRHRAERLVIGVAHAIAVQHFWGDKGESDKRANFEQLMVAMTYFEGLALSFFFEYRMPDLPGTEYPLGTV